MSTFEIALQIAAIAHAGQLDKGGKPYVLHPLRMALKLEAEEERIVALLHDVVEDCAGWTFDKIASYGFRPNIIEALKAVTKDPAANPTDEVQYTAFVQRAAANPIARSVKLADLRDNCDLSRIPNPTDLDHARIAKYKRAIETISGTTVPEGSLQSSQNPTTTAQSSETKSSPMIEPSLANLTSSPQAKALMAALLLAKGEKHQDEAMKQAGVELARKLDK